jgi:hypothetical protein
MDYFLMCEVRRITSYAEDYQLRLGVSTLVHPYQPLQILYYRIITLVYGASVSVCGKIVQFKVSLILFVVFWYQLIGSFKFVFTPHP